MSRSPLRAILAGWHRTFCRLLRRKSKFYLDFLIKSELNRGAVGGRTRTVHLFPRCTRRVGFAAPEYFRSWLNPPIQKNDGAFRVLSRFLPNSLHIRTHSRHSGPQEFFLQMQGLSCRCCLLNSGGRYQAHGRWPESRIWGSVLYFS